MKKTLLICVGVAIAALVLFMVFRRPAVDTDVESPDLTDESPPIQPSKNVTPPKVVKEPTELPLVPPNPNIGKRYESGQKRFLAMFARPISFFGVVQDQFGQPIPNADILLRSADKPWDSPEGIKKTTATNGAFSFKGRGVGLSVSVSKEGYHAMEAFEGSLGSSASFSYTGQPTISAPKNGTREDPSVFVLRKAAVAEPLYENKVKMTLRPAEKPVSIRLIDGNPATTVNFLFTKPISERSNKGYPWKLNISVPSGGIVKQTGPNAGFQAPTEGYVPNYEIDMTDGRDAEIRWTKSTSSELFLKLPSGNYARADVNFYAGSGIIIIKTFYNPSGSPNLEYDSSKIIGKQ